MNPTPKLPDELYLLQLEGTLYGTLMARNLFKSNVTWSSYPFLPPTSASGFLAALIEGERWIEGNGLDLQPRTLHHLPGWENVWALGAFPSLGQPSRKHFRTHLGSTYNYEATLWSAGQNVGKKLAVVEEFWTDSLTFMVVSSVQSKLRELQSLVGGRVGPVAKKGCLGISYTKQAKLLSLKATTAQGHETVLGLIPVGEIGRMPIDAHIYRVPIISHKEGKNMRWQTVDCLWDMSHQTKVRAGINIFAAAQESLPRSLLGLLYQI